MFEELCDQEDEKAATEVFNKYIKYGPQYNVILVDSNAGAKDHANVWNIIDQESETIKVIAFNSQSE